MTTLARVVFLALVGATFAAFFVAQELKSRPPAVEVVRFVRNFSPNDDGRRDVDRLTFRLQDADDITAGMIDADGEEVRRLVTGLSVRAFAPVRLRWDGRTDAGAVAPDGMYRLRVGLRRQGRSVIVPRAVALDTRAPRPLVRRAADQPRVVAPGEPVELRVDRVDYTRPPQLAIWRTDVVPARKVADVPMRPDSRAATWDGRIAGEPAAPGTYLAVATKGDRARNVGSSAPGLPELPEAVAGAPGVTVRSLAVQPPLRPVRAGTRVEFLVDARGREYRWALRRAGQDEAERRGRSGEPRLRVRVPDGPSGVHMLDLRAGGDFVSVPFLVQSARRAPLLVVLPAISWIGQEPGDEDGDGLPETLERGDAVPLDRVLDGRPAGFEDEVLPLLAFLDREGLRYDLTTDLALADSRDPRPTDREGVLLAGPLRWIPPDLGRRLREYALAGGRAASFGIDTLRRGVTVGPDALSRPTAATPDDAFGARLVEPRDLDGASLEPVADDPGFDLFVGTDALLRGFTRIEESRPDPEPGRLLAGLGEQVSEEEAVQAEADGVPVREPLPALAATRTGEGLVIRVGLPEWPRRLRRDPEVAQLHRNILDLVRGRTPRPRTARR